MKDISNGTKDLYMLDPNLLVLPEGWNVRQETPELEEHISVLMESIRELGVQTPITVFQKDGVITVTDGFCRMTAVRRLLAEGVEIKAVPCLPESSYSSEADRTFSMFTRNGGKPLTPLEAGFLFKRMIGYGWTPQEIAKKAGRCISYVHRFLALTAAPADVIKEVEQGTISSSCAAAVVAEHGEKAGEVIREAAKKTGKVKPKDLASTGLRKEFTWEEVGPVLRSYLEQMLKEDAKGRALLLEDAKGFMEEVFGNGQ
jgi:ParB-like chromosome segregation protein Spo0J